MLNYEILESFTLGAAATVPVILAMVQAFKMTGWVKDAYAPFLSMAIGIVICSFLANDFRTDWGNTLMTGVLFGLSASGLYSGMKTTSFAIQAKRDNRYK